MTAKWWANPQTFPAQYEAHADEYIKGLKNNGYTRYYNTQTGVFSYLSVGSYVTIKKNSTCTIPPMVLEFYKSIDVIVKPGARKLSVPDRFQCLSAFICVNFPINCLDWMLFMAEVEYCGVYINCNPESEQYGKILITIYCGADRYILWIVYNNIEEFVTGLNTWMGIPYYPEYQKYQQFTLYAICTKHVKN